MTHIGGINRRLALGLVPMAWMGAAGAVGPRAIGAADALSQAVLRRQLTRIDGGSGDLAQRVRSSFAQVIEQNFALRGPRAAAELVDGLSEQELSDLAILYTNAVSSGGTVGHLLPMLARRLDDERLTRICDHFGFGPTYAALNAVAPYRTSRFALRANKNAIEPRIESFRPRVPPGADSSGGQSPAAGAQRVRYVRTVNIAKYLHYTPYEIYLDFRTAPVGSLSVAGALWETSLILTGGLGTAYYVGEEVGKRIVEPLVRNYAPALYDKIGATLATAVNWLSNSWRGTVLDQGIAQQATAPMFGSSPLQMNYFSFGGDYGVSSSWRSSFSSGGGCHPLCIDVSY